MSGTEQAQSRLGAVLRSVGSAELFPLGPSGPYVAATLEHARVVLTSPESFDFPFDVSREPVRLGPSTPKPGPPTLHETNPSLPRPAVDRGEKVFADELARAAALEEREELIDAMTFLREPVSRSTTAAVLGDLPTADRDLVATLTLDWIDALGPVIARRRPPRRWSRVRRNERQAREALHDQLSLLSVADPATTATMLAAGTQVPIAAGAWLLVLLSRHPDVVEAGRREPAMAAAIGWETIRLYPPTWLLARVTTTARTLGGSTLRQGDVVLVSPLVLGRLESLVPGVDGSAADQERFEPGRWRPDGPKPGLWLPFGAGPHACPGRSLGLAQLTRLAKWALTQSWSEESVGLDASRGLFPNPALLRRAAPGRL